MANIPSTWDRAAVVGPRSRGVAGRSSRDVAGRSSRDVAGLSSRDVAGLSSRDVAGPSSQYVAGTGIQYGAEPGSLKITGPGSEFVLGTGNDVAEPSKGKAKGAARPKGKGAAGPKGKGVAGSKGKGATGPKGKGTAGPKGKGVTGPRPSRKRKVGANSESELEPSREIETGPRRESKTEPSRESEAGPSSASEAGPSRESSAWPSNQQGNRTQRRAAANPYLPTYLTPDDVCLVCGDTPTGSHYKKITCEGCKGFFRRVVQKFKRQPPDFICKKNRNCEITKETRNSCQYCRYQKCLVVKMDTHFVQDEATRQKENEKKKRKKQLTLAKKLTEMTDADWVLLRRMGAFYNCQNVLDCFWLPTEPKNPNAQLHEALVAHAYAFVRNIPGVQRILREDFYVLVKNRLIEVLALQLSEVFDREKESLNFCNAQIMENDTLENEILKHIFNYAKHHSQFCTSDGITLGLLCAITFLNGETLDLKDPQLVKTALDHIISVATKYLRTAGQWRLSKLCLALQDFQYIREDRNRLIWKITGMREEDSEVECLILNDPPEDPVESVEHDEENPSGESDASDLLNTSTSPSANISPRAINPSSASPNILAAALSTIIPSSTTLPGTTSLSTFVSPSTSVISSACTTPGSSDMANHTNDDFYKCSSIKQENDTVRHQYQQSFPPSVAQYFGPVSPSLQMIYQQRLGNMSQLQESSQSNVDNKGGRYMPYSHGQNVSPLSSCSSSSGHSQSFWSPMADYSLRAPSEPLGTTNSETQFVLDLSLHGKNQRSDGHQLSLYRTPQWGCGWKESSNPQGYTRYPLSPTSVRVPGEHSPQNHTPNMPVNITTEQAEISLELRVSQLSQQVDHLRSELAKNKMFNLIDVQRIGSSESKLDSTLHGCTSTQSPVSESAGSSHFNPLMNHPAIEHALSTRQLSYVTESRMRHQFPQMSPPAHSSPSYSRHPLIGFQGMPENISQSHCNTFQPKGPMDDQTTNQHYLQTVGCERPNWHASLKPCTSSALKEEQVYETSAAGNRFQNYQQNSAIKCDYSSAPSESLTLQAAHSTAGESSSATSSVLEKTWHSREPETISLPVKTEQTIIPVKKKWILDHYAEAK